MTEASRDTQARKKGGKEGREREREKEKEKEKEKDKKMERRGKKGKGDRCSQLRNRHPGTQQGEGCTWGHPKEQKEGRGQTERGGKGRKAPAEPILGAAAATLRRANWLAALTAMVTYWLGRKRPTQIQ